MKNIFKSIMIILIVLAAVMGGWFLYHIYGPQLTMEEVLPSNALVYAQLKEPVRFWNSFEKSDLYKNVAGIDIPAVLKHNKVSPQKLDGFMKSYTQATTLMKNPIVGRLLGKEIAFAQYTSKDPKAGLVVITRSLASIQVAANVSLFLKDLGQDIVVKKDQYNGQVVVHLMFKQKDLSFKYTHIRNLLVFTDESSTLINNVIATVQHKHPSLKSDDQFKEVAANFYPKAQGSFYVDIKGMMLSAEPQWAGPLAKQTGFKAYGVSFLPGNITKYKFLLTYDQEKIDPSFKRFLACSPADNNAFSLVPPSAIAYHWGGCYEFKEIAAQLKAGAEAALQNQPKRIRKSLQKKISGSEVTDFIGLLGPEAGGYVTDVDTHGLVPYPRLLFFVKVTDALKAKTLLDEVVGSKHGLSLIGREDYKGNDIHYIALPLGSNMDPGFVFKGDYFLLASSRQLLKKSMDIYKDPSTSIAQDKQFKAMGFNTGIKATAVFYFKVKEMANRALGILEWYERYLSNQVELAGTYKKEAEAKKKELARDVINQAEELRLAQVKLSEWQNKSTEGLSPEDLANNMGTIKNFEDQINQVQAAIKDDQAQVKEIDRVIAKNTVQAENYRGIMYNASHVLMPFFKGLGSINVQGVKFSSLLGTVQAELMLN